MRIQRVRCKKCGRTTNVLPSFLLAHKKYAVVVVKQLVMTYINRPKDWKQFLDIDIDLATAYRWLPKLVAQANNSLPHIRKELLKLKPDHPIDDGIDKEPPQLTSTRKILKRFVSLAEQLFKAAVRLVDTKKPNDADSFCFLNYFLATQTGKALLQS